MGFSCFVAVKVQKIGILDLDRLLMIILSFFDGIKYAKFILICPKCEKAEVLN